jgi:hypothetical protein
MDSTHPELVQVIGTGKKMDEGTISALEQAIKDFKQTFE